MQSGEFDGQKQGMETFGGLAGKIQDQAKEEIVDAFSFVIQENQVTVQ